jgi:hypothetical protein
MLSSLMEAKAVNKKPAKRNRKKRQIYSGALAEPGHSRLRLPLEGRLGDVDTFYGKKSEEEIIAHNAATINSEADNLLLLMDHYGIDRGHKDGWCLLAFALARDHVPAFRPPPARGRPKKDIDKLKVYFAVQNKVANNNALSVNDAITFVQKEEYSKVRPKTVADWYYEVAPEAEKLFSKTRELDELHKGWTLAQD